MAHKQPKPLLRPRFRNALLMRIRGLYLIRTYGDDRRLSARGEVSNISRRDVMRLLLKAANGSFGVPADQCNQRNKLFHPSRCPQPPSRSTNPCWVHAERLGDVCSKGALALSSGME